MVDTEIGAKFSQAATYVQGAMTTGIQISQSNQLDFYGLYKQATCRSRDDFNHLGKPAFWQFTATRKYWAWERYSHISKYEALVKYVKKCKQVFPEWHFDPKGSNLSC